MTARYIVATVFGGLASLAPASVDLVLTSPPFLALRSYLPNGHALKHREIGSEPTPADYLDTLLDVTEACDRVLAPHGSLVFELGDTYAGNNGFDRMPYERKVTDRALFRVDHARGNGWPLDKSLTGTPHLFAFSLAYGRNLLRPERTTEPWRIRNLVAWCRPNPPVGALGDKFRPATSYLVMACKSRARYFDLDAVRTKLSEPGRTFCHQDDPNPGHGWATSGQHHGFEQNRAGAPPLDWWELPTAPYSGAHYATWPPDLLIRPILSMCPAKVCKVCGEPSRRIVKPTDDYASRPTAGRGFCADAADTAITGQTDRNGWRGTAAYETLGWTDCGHNDWRRGVVLDPFAGTGSTLMVAIGHGRDAVGIDLDDRNAELVRERNGMFVTVEP